MSDKEIIMGAVPGGGKTISQEKSKKIHELLRKNSAYPYYRKQGPQIVTIKAPSPQKCLYCNHCKLRIGFNLYCTLHDKKVQGDNTCANYKPMNCSDNLLDYEFRGIKHEG